MILDSPPTAQFTTDRLNWDQSRAGAAATTGAEAAARAAAATARAAADMMQDFINTKLESAASVSLIS